MRAMVCGETGILWLFCFTLFYDAINVLSLFFLLWKNGIQQNCHQSCHNNRRFAEDSCYPGRECSKGSRCLCDSHTKSYGQPYNGGVAVVHLLEHDELDSGHGDGSKDGDRCSSQHCGIVVKSAENFGTNPAIRRITAASPRTQRLMTLVVVTIPTFWL